MKICSLLICCFTFCISLKTTAQLQKIKGKVIASDDVEGIHVLNKTALKYTTTTIDGSFEILVRLNDTITISSLKYLIEEVVITKKIISNNTLVIPLTERVNQLNEVVIGTILTGSLESDIRNTNVETPINFYDLNIPGYTGKHKTLYERKLAEATSGAGGIPLFALINAITGRTKKLKEQVQLSRDIKCAEYLKSEYKDVIFEDKNYPSKYQSRFFDFIMYDESFRKICINKTSLDTLNFLQTQFIAFNKILNNSANKN